MMTCYKVKSNLAMDARRCQASDKCPLQIWIAYPSKTGHDRTVGYSN